MSTYEYYNPNPRGNRTRDCVIRAMSAVLGISWDKAFDLIAARAKEMGLTMDDNAVYGSILREWGFYRATIPNRCPDCYSADDFAREHKHGIFILGFTQHVAAVIEGKILDSWDSSDEIPQYYWALQED